MHKRIITVSEKVLNENRFNELKKTKDNEEKESWFSQSFREFCSATALHGYSYIVRKDISRWERIGWAVIVVAALITSIILLWVSWEWNAETKTTTVIESTHYAVSNVPFPAVSICGMNRISLDGANRLAERMKLPDNVTSTELSKMFRLLLHFEGISKPDPNGYALLNEILISNNMTVPSVFKEISPNCTNMLERCKWKGTQTRCDSLFQTIYTSEGICCSFNYLGLPKSNFPSKSKLLSVPMQVTACGYLTGLTFLAKPFVQDYHSSYLSSMGFRVYIHNSYDYPDDNAETKTVGAKLEAFISLSPESTYSTPSVYNLPLKDRDCYFPKEGKMNTMSRYSYVNCMAECRSNLIYELCGCVPFEFPNNGTLPTCGMDKVECVTEHKQFYSGALPGVNSTSALREDSPCKCLPDCVLYQYPSEISSGRLNRTFSYNSVNFFKDINLEDQSLIHVFFIDLVSTRYRKASFGGLLGLLLGFSFVTGFELIYFFTIRPLFDRFGKRK
ncbi:hypothetical protein HA402_006033 [Bradysia odoriphaga]|nr:hypothetical protein HA402_006033 [Bradysia odoriphaga]